MNINLLEIDTLINDVKDSGSKFIVIDSRPEPEYLAGHIPGSVRIAWEEWCEPAPVEAAPIIHEPGYWGTLGNTNSFEQRLEDAGIRQHDPIVVYADSARSKGREGRVAWMLLYLGATKVYMLDRGFRDWVSSGAAVETGVPTSKKSGDFKITLDERRRAKYDQLFERSDSTPMPLMIDVRTAAEFHGDCYDYQPVKGKLPNSILFPFADLFEANGMFINREKYLEITPPDILKSNSRVSYCEVGVRASTFSLLHEIYTGEIIPVYDGSIMEWGWYLNASKKLS